MINLSNFHLLKEDAKHYTVKHPNGRELKLEKEKLSPSASDTIKKMARGGGVDQSNHPQELPTETRPLEQRLNKDVMGNQVSHNPNPKVAAVSKAHRFPEVGFYDEGGTAPETNLVDQPEQPAEEQSSSSAVNQPVIHNHYYMAPQSSKMPEEAKPEQPKEEPAAPSPDPTEIGRKAYEDRIAFDKKFNPGMPQELSEREALDMGNIAKSREQNKLDIAAFTAQQEQQQQLAQLQATNAKRQSIGLPPLPMPANLQPPTVMPQGKSNALKADLFAPSSNMVTDAQGQNIPQGEAQGVPGQPPISQQGTPEDYLQAAKAQEQNLYQQGKISGDQAQRDMAAQQAYYQNQQRIAQEMERVGTEYHKNFEDMAGQVASAQIDPNRWWNQKSTGSKIASAIAMLFSGAGAGVSGHPEMALNALNSIIDQDIQAQKFNIENKSNLLNKYTDQYKSSTLGLDALRLQYGAMTEGLIKRSAAMAGTQTAQLAANQAINQLRMGLAPALENVTKASAMTNIYASMGKPVSGGANSEQAYNQQLSNMAMLNPEIYKDMQAKYVPGVGVAKVPLTPENRTELQNFENLSKSLNEAMSIQKKAGNAGAWTPELRKDAKDVKEALAISLHELYGLKRINDIEYENYKDQIGNIGGVNFGTTLRGLQNLQSQVNSKKSTAFKQLGISPFGGGSNMDQQALEWAKKKPHDPRAAKIRQLYGMR